MTQRPIVVATDFSDCGSAAVTRATRLAAALRAPLRLLHVASPGGFNALLYPQGPSAWRQEVLTRAGEALAVVAARCREELAQAGAPDTVVEVEVRDGVPVNEIADAAEAADARLLVLGVRAGATWADALIGSTTDRVLSKATRPVLVVRRPPAGDYRRIGVGVDFSDYSQPALGWAQALAQAAPGTTLEMVHAQEPLLDGGLPYAPVDSHVLRQHADAERAQAMQALADLAARRGLQPGQGVRCEVVDGLPRQVLDELSRSGVDLLVVGKHGRSRIEEWLLGSVTRHVLSHAGCDVLVTGQRD
jgi:nucleotide-binding universal stress UspA family protein